jgi:hypothetical protein
VAAVLIFRKGKMEAGENLSAEEKTLSFSLPL